MREEKKKIRVLICNKYTLFREGIKSVVQKGAFIEVVGEANTVGEAVEQLYRLRPDAVLMDMTTPDVSGFEATRRIKTIDPDVKVLILSLHDDEILTSLCLEAGADGYIQRDKPAWYLQGAIQAACRLGKNSRAATAVALPPASEVTAAAPSPLRVHTAS